MEFHKAIRFLSSVYIMSQKSNQEMSDSVEDFSKVPLPEGDDDSQKQEVCSE